MLMGLSTHLVASMAGCVALHVSDVSPVVVCVCAVRIIVLCIYVPDLCFLLIYSFVPLTSGREEAASSPPHIMYVCILCSIHMCIMTCMWCLASFEIQQNHHLDVFLPSSLPM